MAVVIDLLLAYFVYFLTRVAYLLENWSYFQNLTSGELLNIFSGGLLFDTSAIFYTNALWIVMVLLPLHWKETAAYHKVCRCLFVVVNGLAAVMNLADSVYFTYTLRRSTSTLFSEFSNESNLGSVVSVELLNHWYLVLLAVLLIGGLWKAYRVPGFKPVASWRYYLTSTLMLVALVILAIGGIRGGFTKAVRPITISNANQYAPKPTEAALVLNTPFSMIRTVGKDVFKVPSYFATEEEMVAVFTPIHHPQPADTVVYKPKNVVILIVESFGREYFGAFNHWLEDGNYKGYTPFLDSLVSQSVAYRYSFCNGRKSIDGMPSILAGIPMFVEPFILTPASMNDKTGIAGILGERGYESAFFHGAQNGSMGFNAFAASIGFQKYYGRTEFNEDPRFRGDADFDGTWAIWDEPFLQFYSRKMDEMKEPFVTAVFTASSHHPFAIPAQYKDTFPEEGLAIHKCVRYTDHALRRFFEISSRAPWFKNTLFVMTSDHTNFSDHAEYQTDLGGFSSPVIFYDPSGDLQPAMVDAVAQQIDILPTVLGLLGYDRPFLSFGCDLFNTPARDTWAVNYLNGIYQYVKWGYVLQFDGQKTTGVYSLEDKLMEHNLVGSVAEQGRMELELKAVIQQYMMRMKTNRLLPDAS